MDNHLASSLNFAGWQKAIFLRLLLLLFLASVASLSTAGGLTIPGSGDSQQLLRALALEYNRHSGKGKVVIPDSIGSSGGIREVLEGRAKLARTARPLKEQEREGLTEIEFATVPLVFVTNASLESLPSLMPAQIVGIYGGEITNWQDVGGPAQKIYVVNREVGDSSLSVLEKELEGFADRTHTGVIVYSTPETVATIESNDFTIGYLPMSEVIQRQLNPIAINGVGPEASDYPLRNRFYIVSRGEPEGAARDFVEFLFSDVASDIMVGYGVIPVGRR